MLESILDQLADLVAAKVIERLKIPPPSREYVSRAELAELTGMSPATVSKRVAELEDQGGGVFRSGNVVRVNYNEFITYMKGRKA